MSNPCRLTKLNLMFLIGTNVVLTYLILIYRTQHNFFEPILEINLGIYFDNIWPGMKFHLLIRLIMIYYCEVNTLDASMFVIGWSTKNYIRTKIRFRGFQIHVTEFSISCPSSTYYSSIENSIIMTVDPRNDAIEYLLKTTDSVWYKT